MVIGGTCGNRPGGGYDINLTTLNNVKTNELNPIVLREGETVTAAVEMAIGLIRESLSDAPPLSGPKWNLESESNNLLKEAKWAHTAGLFADAEAMAMSAEALNPKLGEDKLFKDWINRIRLDWCLGLNFRITHSENYSNLLRSAINLSNSSNQQSCAEKFEQMEFVLRTITRVLDYGYRHRYHLDPDTSGSLASLRAEARELYRKGREIYLAQSLNDIRMKKHYRAWSKTVATSGGLWFDDKSSGWQHWNELATKTLEIVPQPNRGFPSHSYERYEIPQFIVPPAIDWTRRFSLKEALADWLNIRSELIKVDPVIGNLYLFSIKNDLREWYARYYNMNIIPYLNPSWEVTKLLKRHNAIKDNLGLNAYVRENAKALLALENVDFYLPAFFRDSVNRYSGKENTWIDGVASEFAVGFACQKMLKSDVALPSIYDFFFTDYWVEVETMHEGPALYKKTTREQDGRLASAFFDHLKRVTVKSPDLDKDAFDHEFQTLEKNGYFPKRNQITAIHPDALLTLRDPVHLGYPLEVKDRSQDIIVFSAIDEDGHWAIIETLPDKSGKRFPAILHLHSINLETRLSKSCSIALPGHFFGNHAMGLSFLKKLFVNNNDWLIYVGFNIGEEMKSSHEKAEYIVHANFSTKETTSIMVSPKSNWFVSHLYSVEGDTAYYLQLNEPGDKVRLNEAVVTAANHRLLSYDIKNRKVDVIFDTLRSPAKNFLDDRNHFEARWFGHDQNGNPLLCGLFEFDGVPKKLWSALVWNQTSKKWSVPQLQTCYNYAQSSYRSGFFNFQSSSGGSCIYTGKDDRTGFQAYGVNESGAWYHAPPEKYLLKPIGSAKSALATIFESSQFITTLNMPYCKLLVRSTPKDQESIVLRVVHKETGPHHYDLILELKDHPKMNRNYYKEDFSGGPDYRYKWSLDKWKNGLALSCINNWEQQNHYLISEGEILQKLKSLSKNRTELTQFETLLDEDLNHFEEIEGSSPFKRSQIEIALRVGDQKTISEYLSQAPPLDEKFGTRSLDILSYASLKGDLSMVKLLINSGFNPSKLSEIEKRPPIAYAIESGNIELVRFLAIHAGTDFDVSPHNPPILWQALATGNRELVKIFGSQLDPDIVKKTSASGMINAHQFAIELLQKAPTSEAPPTK